MGGHFSRRAFIFGGTSGGLMLAAGCDLLELAQNPVINFKLPPRTYTLRTDDPNWKTPPSFFMTQPISCTSKESCCPPPGTPPGTGIEAQCAQIPIVCETNLCGISFPLEVFNTIDLAKETSLSSMDTKSIKEITLESLEYKINNGVGVDFPPVKLYIGPAESKTASAGGVQFIGETPRAPGGKITTDKRIMADDAKAAFAMYAKNFKTPFNFIAATTMSVLSGSNVSTGQVDIEVTGTISARLSI